MRLEPARAPEGRGHQVMDSVCILFPPNSDARHPNPAGRGLLAQLLSARAQHKHGPYSPGLGQGAWRAPLSPGDTGTRRAAGEGPCCLPPPPIGTATQAAPPGFPGTWLPSHESPHLSLRTWAWSGSRKRLPCPQGPGWLQGSGRTGAASALFPTSLSDPPALAGGGCPQPPKIQREKRGE